MEVSSYVLKSTKNKSFGTAFSIIKDDKGSFLVTCAHVVEECGRGNLIVKNENNNLSAKLIDIGSSEGIDLAIIYVEGLVKDTSQLQFSALEEKEGTPFTLNGFKLHKQNSYLEETLKGTILKNSKIHTENQVIKTYELKIENDDKIEKGYSGSAIIADMKIIGVATDRKINGKEAYSIPIKYLEKIWQDMPQELYEIIEEKKQKFVEEIINDEKVPKEVRESSKKFLEYSYMMKKYPKLSLIVLISVILWYFKDSIYTEVKKDINSTNSSQKIEVSKIYHYWGQITKVNIGLPRVKIENYKNKKLDVTDENGYFDFNSTIKDIKVKYKIGKKKKEEYLIEGENNELE